jgi:hypothetical protein
MEAAEQAIDQRVIAGGGLKFEQVALDVLDEFVGLFQKNGP